MTQWTLQLFHRLPAPVRNVVANLKGLHLRSWRYGPETDGLVSEAIERDYWSEKQWKMWQEERLAYVLHRAATHVPYYREQWAARRRRGDRASWEYLENWPILDKEPLRVRPRDFLADDCDARRLYREHTSGTTGKPIDLWWSRQTVRAWYALFEARARKWNGVSRKDRWAILGGQLVTPFDRTRPPFWVWNQALSQLYMSSYHLAPDFVPAYADALSRYEITYLFGYPSAMNALASIVLEQGLEVPSLKVAISNAEPVYPDQRKNIARAFQCEVADTYGMAELACAASECSAGNMHLWPEVGILEVAAPMTEELVPSGQFGRFICTGILNPDMPLIRYEVGDCGALSEEQGNCECGRGLPLLGEVEGRLDDVVLTRDGRRVGRLDPVFKTDLPLREAQIIQESLDCVRVRFIPTRGYSQRDARTIVERLHDRLGDMEILLEPVDHIPRDANGKFRSVICKVTDESL